EQCLLIEYQTQCDPGVFMLMSTTTVWTGVLFVKEGVYRDAIVRFQLLFEDYPTKPPKIIVKTRLDHPLVHPLSGRVNLEFGFPVWHEQLFVRDVMLYLTTILVLDEATRHAIEVETQTTLDSAFDQNAHYLAQESNKFIFEDCDSEIVFSPWDLDVHPQVLARLL
ncbi:hypothetical protein EDD86DRAFT_173809, partial [Gorgonomyces haynaldii]